MAFSESASIAATVVQSDGKIVVVGNSGASMGPRCRPVPESVREQNRNMNLSLGLLSLGIPSV